MKRCSPCGCNIRRILSGLLILIVSSWAIGAERESKCRKIVSLAPNITETLYALNLGDRIVGVTPFCVYPPEAVTKPKIGGFLDPNYEAIVALSPDLILGLSSHREHRQRLEHLGFKLMILPMNTVSEILDAITAMGTCCDMQASATALRNGIESRMARLRELSRDAVPRRVMICIGRDYQQSRLDQVYIAGPGSFHDGIIELAGGRNAYNGPVIEYPAVSSEGVLAMNPDLIIEMRPGVEVSINEQARMLDAWQNLEGVHAVTSNRIYIWTEDFVSIPGPRFIDIAEKLARLLHSDNLSPETSRVRMP